MYRTLADPAHLDPTIEPDDRPLGSIFAAPRPPRCQLRVWRARPHHDGPGRLSTWSGLSSGAAMESTLPVVTLPTLMIHATADTEIRLSQARAVRDASGATDLTYTELRDAPHYLDGHRREALDLVADWLRTRVP